MREEKSVTMVIATKYKCYTITMQLLYNASLDLLRFMKIKIPYSKIYIKSCPYSKHLP